MSIFRVSLIIEIEGDTVDQVMEDVRESHCIVIPGEVGSVSYELDCVKIEPEDSDGEEDDQRFAKDRDEWRHEAAEQQRLK